MDDEVRLGTGGEEAGTVAKRRLVPMRVGEASVYIEVAGEPPSIEGDEEIYAAATKDPVDAFRSAGEVLQEVVRTVGEQVAALGEEVRPDQVSAEFSLSFEAGGKAQLIPVLFTGETKAVSGLKVTAVWETSSLGPRDG
ncbi:hypothetical protein GBA63_17690 [Rubrobacter tropicus]|uniref:Trypsin-co-occurring domain-containing protein n=1 Tax=Rubrobacter tropicus TaxID=2653851 RepID=A0A6G8QCW4_9ACTN|nr:CU044_2847 family protein [Rubrobacter tropicus]QIN84278.1 hypothetical protein GBA63_17690 [Rubrobacter tropicus]